MPAQVSSYDGHVIQQNISITLRYRDSVKGILPCVADTIAASLDIEVCNIANKAEGDGIIDNCYRLNLSSYQLQILGKYFINACSP